MSLVELSPEIMDMVADHLVWSDLRSLRLTHRRLCSNIPRATKFFNTKSIQMTLRSLGEANEMTQKGRIGCHLKHLTLQGVIYDAEDVKPTAEVKRQQAVYQDQIRTGAVGPALSEALECLAANTQVQSITLEMMPSAANIRLMWPAATQTLELFLSAYKKSSLTVSTLRIYCNIDAQCSLPCNTIPRADEQLNKKLAALEQLSLSISDRLIDRTEKELEWTNQAKAILQGTSEDVVTVPSKEKTGSSSAFTNDSSDSDSDTEVCCFPGPAVPWMSSPLLPLESVKAQASCESNFTAFSDWLGQCSNVKSLDLYFFTLGKLGYGEPIDYLRERHFRSLANADLPSLEECKITAMPVMHHDLVQFMERHSLRRLSLKHVMIRGGDFDTVLQCANKRIGELHAVCISDQRGLVCFNQEDGVKDESHSQGCEEIRVRRGEMDNIICNHFRRLRQANIIQRIDREKRVRRLYGSSVQTAPRK